MIVSLQKEIETKRNIAANFVGRALGVVFGYLFVPFYLKALGIEAYGLVGFYSTLLGVLAFADMGFTATLTREMARLSVREDSAEELGDLVRTYETTYGVISALVAGLIWFLAPLITEHWLQFRSLSPDVIVITLRLMGVSIAFQLPSNLYAGGLMGLQRQIQVNSLQIAWGAFRGFGAVLVLSFLSPTIFAFAVWQLIANGLYCSATRWSLWRALPLDRARTSFKPQVFRDTWRYAMGMACMTLLSILLTQTDRLVVSKMLSLEMLGYYTLAGALASVPVMLASPIASAVFPRFTGLVATGDRNSLTGLYHKTCAVVAIAIIPVALTLMAFAREAIFAWTGSPTAAQRAGLAASLLLGGQLVQAISVVPYYLALAFGNVQLYLYVGIASVVLVSPLLIVLVWKFGLVGAGLSWLVMNLCTLPFSAYLFHRQFMPGEARRWCWDVGRPLLATLPFVLIGRRLLPHTSSRMLALCLIATVWGLSAIASACIVPYSRQLFMKMKTQWLGLSYVVQD